MPSLTVGPAIKAVIFVALTCGLLAFGYWRGMEKQKSIQTLSNEKVKVQDNEKLIPIIIRNERMKQEDNERAKKILDHADPILDAPIPDDLLQSFRDKINRARGRADTPMLIREITGWSHDGGDDVDLDRQSDNSAD